MSHEPLTLSQDANYRNKKNQGSKMISFKQGNQDTGKRKCPAAWCPSKEGPADFARSGAGVGVVMLRGAGDPLLDFFGFRDLSRFPPIAKFRFLAHTHTWEKPIVVDPRKIQSDSRKSQSFSNIFLIYGNCLCLMSF